MGLFSKKKNNGSAGVASSAALAQRSLDFIAEGVLLVDERGMIRFANPAAAAMTGYGAADNITGLDYKLVIRLETAEGMPVDITQTQIYTAVMTNQAATTRQYLLVSAQNEHRIAITLSCIPTGDVHSDRILTFRDITKELAEENEQAEFISTASHEMRTPVASIEGYLGLALNPQTATIDARARQYLEAAHAASQHLGHLFKDLLDVTKLDDSRERVHLVPVDAVEAVRHIAGEREKDMQAKHLKYSFGSNGQPLDKKRIDQKVYMAVDYDFLHEIIDNLVENAIKYTPEGGEIWVNARGDGDKVLINVTDTGIGISADDINHIFQKFYRVDNSQTRQIGGTGLGLYLVKQRVEALGGRVWAESAFGDGSTFFVALPRITESEYEKMRIAQANEQMVKQFSAPSPTMAPVQTTLAQPTAATTMQQPVIAQTTSQPATTPQAAPSQVATSQPVAAQQSAAAQMAPVQAAGRGVAVPAAAPTPRPQPPQPSADEAAALATINAARNRTTITPGAATVVKKEEN